MEILEFIFGSETQTSSTSHKTLLTTNFYDSYPRSSTTFGIYEMAANYSPKIWLTRDDAISILLANLLGTVPKGMGVLYSLIEENESFFSFSAAMDDGASGHLQKHVDRCRVDIDRASGEMQPPVLISLSRDEIANAIQCATGYQLANYARFNDGALSISYKASVVEDPDVQYVLQLRHHGDVASMNAIMQLVARDIDPHILPIPKVYPIPTNENGN